MNLRPPLWLASASTRRRRLLDEARIAAIVHPPDIDDAMVVRGRVGAAAWTMALAWFKACRVALSLDGPRTGTILAADTVCVLDDAILGQPRNEEDAGRMLRALSGRAHRTITGVCLLCRDSGARVLFFDEARVNVGPLTTARLRTYIESGGWRGKAGGYNLADRIEAGWPITCEGDPTTVMGLPMRRLLPRLHGLVARPETRPA